MFGDAGNDVMVGGGGGDTMHGGAGSDLMEGAGGNDHLFGDAGNDELHGGTLNPSVPATIVQTLDCGAGSHDKSSAGPVGESRTNCEDPA